MKYWICKSLSSLIKSIHAIFMRRLLILSLVTVFIHHSICYAQQESIFQIKNKILGSSSNEKYAMVERWIIKRFLLSEKLGIGSFDSVLRFLPAKYQTDAGRYVLDYLYGGLSDHAYNLILDSIYNVAFRTNDFWGQCDLLRYFNGRKLGSYKAELDSAYRLAKKINNAEVIASNTLFQGNYYFDKTQFDSAIYFYRKSLKYYLYSKNGSETSAEIYDNIALTYLRKGEIDSSLFYNHQAIHISKDTAYIGHKIELVTASNFFKLIGKYDSAFYYLKLTENAIMYSKEPSVQSRLYRSYVYLFCAVNDLNKGITNAQNYLNYAIFNKDTLQLIDAYTCVSFLKQLAHMKDSAIYYSSKGIQLLKNKDDVLFASALLLQHGNNFLSLNNTDSAFYYINEAYEKDSISGASLNMAQDAYSRGNVFLHKHDTITAFRNFLYAKSLLQPVTDIVLARDIYHALSLSAFELHNVVDAWRYQNKFIELNDSINRFQNIYALNELDTRYKLNEEQQQIKNLVLVGQRNMLWMISLAILLLFVISFLIFLRITYRSKAQLNLKELQQRALRAQLNPHFVFNVMQSIKNEYSLNTQRGEEMLVNFSALMREVLDKSFLSETTLQDEIDLIKKYLTVESHRTASALSFTTKLDGSINASQVAFPSLALQPIIENAVKYGAACNDIILSIGRKGSLLVIAVENDLPEDFHLNTFSSTRSSTGLRLTEERINLFNKKYKTKGSLESIKKDSRFTTTISLAYVIKQPEVL